MSTIVGIITARGGSKTISNKNTAILAGKPLIAWSIEASLQSRLLDRVIVSTDDAHIADISEHHGAEVPFVRPAELAQDASCHISVLLHAIDWLEKADQTFPDYIMLLQPTSPLRSAQDIDRAIKLALDKNADSVVSVSQVSRHPFFCRRITNNGKLKGFIDVPAGYLRRQTLPPAYAMNGAMYLVKRDILVGRETFETENTYAYIMPPQRSLDIDTPWDLFLADLIMSKKFQS